MFYRQAIPWSSIRRESSPMEQLGHSDRTGEDNFGTSIRITMPVDGCLLLPCWLWYLGGVG